MAEQDSQNIHYQNDNLYASVFDPYTTRPDDAFAIQGIRPIKIPPEPILSTTPVLQGRYNPSYPPDSDEAIGEFQKDDDSFDSSLPDELLPTVRVIQARNPLKEHWTPEQLPGWAGLLALFDDTPILPSANALEEAAKTRFAARSADAFNDFPTQERLQDQFTSSKAQFIAREKDQPGFPPSYRAREILAAHMPLFFKDKWKTPVPQGKLEQVLAPVILQHYLHQGEGTYEHRREKASEATEQLRENPALIIGALFPNAYTYLQEVQACYLDLDRRSVRLYTQNWFALRQALKLGQQLYGKKHWAGLDRYINILYVTSQNMYAHGITIYKRKPSAKERISSLSRYINHYVEKPINYLTYHSRVYNSLQWKFNYYKTSLFGEKRSGRFGNGKIV